MVVPTFESVDEFLNLSVVVQMKAFKQYFPLVLFKVFLTLESVEEILTCDHSYESC